MRQRGRNKEEGKKKGLEEGRETRRKENIFICLSAKQNKQEEGRHGATRNSGFHPSEKERNLSGSFFCFLPSFKSHVIIYPTDVL